MTQRFDPAWLDRMYNNRALVPGHETHFLRWAEASEHAREALPCTLDIAYGDTAGQTLDVFHAKAPGAPVVVFIHGGYWRSLDKSDHSFLASLLREQGACVVIPNYDLCPAVTIPGIALQMTRALAWTWHHAARFGGDAGRISVIGHSAGGHLAAMLLACRWQAVDRALPRRLVRAAMGISGLYDLEPVRQVPFLKDSLRLTPEDARRASPALFPAPAAGAFHAVCGADESAEFIRHNRLIRQAWGAARVPVCEELPGLQHFSVLEALSEPGHRLLGIARTMMDKD